MSFSCLARSSRAANPLNSSPGPLFATLFWFTFVYSTQHFPTQHFHQKIKTGFEVLKNINLGRGPRSHVLPWSWKPHFALVFLYFLSFPGKTVSLKNLKRICDSKKVEKPLTQTLRLNKDYYWFLQTMNKLHSQLFAKIGTCNLAVVWLHCDLASEFLACSQKICLGNFYEQLLNTQHYYPHCLWARTLGRANKNVLSQIWSQLQYSHTAEWKKHM